LTLEELLGNSRKFVIAEGAKAGGINRSKVHLL
jgi:hypothetical protein